MKPVHRSGNYTVPPLLQNKLYTRDGGLPATNYRNIVETGDYSNGKPGLAGALWSGVRSANDRFTERSVLRCRHPGIDSGIGEALRRDRAKDTDHIADAAW
jgi:hypothetical protein